MLSSLSISNLALIDALEVEFSPGLNILTGETGAGKSIIISAVQLLLGNRADKGVIRSGSDQCRIAAVYELGEQPNLQQRVDALIAESGGPACEDGQLIVCRAISAKSSRCHVNSTPVNLSVLRELGELLVDVHGPYDHQSLLNPARQLDALDGFAGVSNLRKKIREAWAGLRSSQEDLDAWERQSFSPAQMENMRFQVQEIREAKLNPAEIEALSARHAMAANRKELLEVLESARQRLSEGNDAVDQQLSSTIRDLYVIEEIDAEGGGHLTGLLESVINELRNFQDELADYATRIDADPRQLAEIEERLGLVHKLKRKYGRTVEDVLAYADKIEADLEKMENFENHREQLAAAVEAAEAVVLKHAKSLAAKRRKAGPKLAKALTEKLRVLGFANSAFSVDLSETALSMTGSDHCEFVFSPNVGEGAHNLRQIASSGEISRVMLALKTVLAAADQVPVLIFDEIDANIGGPTATVVGREMVALGRERQIICISHLPQVAAGADRHFAISKATKAKRTVAQLAVLDRDARIAELARMLGGKDSSSVVEQHAAELIRQARGE
jgi:DNA repair protein RecN (Recombination protein N)